MGVPSRRPSSERGRVAEARGDPFLRRVLIVVAVLLALAALLERAQRLLVEYDVVETRPGWQDLFREAPRERVLGALTATGRGLIGGIFGAGALLVPTLVSAGRVRDAVRGGAPPRAAGPPAGA
jgi:uncharacterized membrane protein YfcA